MKLILVLLCLHILVIGVVSDGYSLQQGAGIKLPGPARDGTVPLEKCLALRRSIRSFGGEALTLQQVSQLLWASQGITEPRRGLRAAPSAGALYPLEIYVIASRVKGLEPGVYKYRPEGHELSIAMQGDRRDQLTSAALGQECIGSAPAAFVISAVYERTTRKYGERGRRYVHIDTGAAGENLFLQAVAQGLGAVMVGSFDDQGVKRAVGMLEDEHPLLIMPVGVPG